MRARFEAASPKPRERREKRGGKHDTPRDEPHRAEHGCGDAHEQERAAPDRGEREEAGGAGGGHA